MERTITEIRERPQEFLRSLNAEMYRRAYNEGLSLSAYVEQEMPQSEYKDGLDAFSRLIKAAGIKVRSFPAAGVWADKCEAFFKDERTRALFPEFCARQWRQVTYYDHHNTRAIYSDGDDPLDSVAHPVFKQVAGRWDKQVAAAIPAGMLIAITTPIDSDAYKAYYLQDNPAQSRKVRVGSGEDIPTAKLVGGDRQIQLWKFGRGLEMTYEEIRRMRIDKISLHLQRMAVQSEVDRVATIIDVMVNGDGNTGTTPTAYNLTALDSGATANNTTLKAWIAFKMKFANPYQCLVALAQEDIALKLALLNAGSANIPLSMMPANVAIGGFTAINPGLADGSGLGWTADAPANKVVASDTRFAIERVTEIGSNIQEVERFVRNQTQLITMTEVEGYAVMDANATKVLVNNA
ncbi:MAG: hypothetical protein AB1631_17420 [Acidobacteriota bacterium]